MFMFMSCSIILATVTEDELSHAQCPENDDRSLKVKVEELDQKIDRILNQTECKSKTIINSIESY